MILRKSHPALLAAVAGLALFAGSASAQVRVNQDGSAMDANPRVGSGGLNTSAMPPASIQAIENANRIVTGNVTGGKQFRGRVQSRDPREFRDDVGGAQTDRFIRNSSGVPTAYGAAAMPGESQIYYGRSLANASVAPEGTARSGSTGTYTQMVPMPEAADPRRLDAIYNSGLKPSDFLMPGPVDPRTSLPTFISASPLMGVRQLSAGDVNDRSFLDNLSSLREESAAARLQLDSATWQQLRRDLTEEGPGNMLSNPMPNSFDTPPSPLLNNDPLGAKPLGGEVRRVLTPPAKQSTQYASLEERLSRFYEERFNAEDPIQQAFLEQLKTAKAATPARPAFITPNYSKMAQAWAAARAKTPGKTPEPVKITSLSAGVPSPALQGVIKKGEELLKTGKYTEAARQFQAARELAPNNRLILVGLAHAELGGGYYDRAEQHLRQALLGDPVLTMAQFDLRRMLQQDRLEIVIRELKDVAKQQEKDTGAPFLLAYVAYHTNSATEATVFLDLADKRAGGKDPLFTILKSHWALGAGPATRPVE